MRKKLTVGLSFRLEGNLVEFRANISIERGKLLEVKLEHCPDIANVSFAEKHPNKGVYNQRKPRLNSCNGIAVAG